MFKGPVKFASVCALTLAPLFTAAIYAPAPAFAQISIGISVNIAPPILPVYVQPPLPAPGYIWAPGYWAWDADDGDYYWVPGAWVSPPRPGLLWTPGYWGWNEGVYVFRTGYWGQTVGFYGGVSYGFGYTGDGYHGGEWRGNQFYYNRSVNNVTNVNVTNVYNRTVIVNNNAPRASFNGGPSGIAARPTPLQLAAAKGPHVPPTVAQAHHAEIAKTLPDTHFKANQGKPANAAVEKPLSGGPVAPAKGELAKPNGALEKPTETGKPGTPGTPAVTPHGLLDKGAAPLDKTHELAKPVGGAVQPKTPVHPLPEHAAPVRPLIDRTQPQHIERVERPLIERPQPQHIERVERPHPQPVAPHFAAPPRPAPPRPAPAPHPQPCRGPQCPK